MTWPISAGGEFSAQLVLALGHFLWQGAAIAAVAFLIAPLAGRSPRARYAIYLCALGVMTAAPIATFLLLAGPPPVAAASHVRSAISADATSGPQQPSRPAEEAPARVAASPGPGLPQTIGLPMLQPPAADSPRGIVRVGASVPAIAPPANVPASWRRYAPRLAAAYFAGVLAMLGRLLYALGSARRLRRSAAPLRDARVLSSIAAVCHRLGVARAPAVSLCARAGVPVVVGILRPMILLPASVLTGLTPEQLRAILAHEVAHLRRLDPWANLFQQLVEAALFFHPAVWLISRRVRAERELCCDDLAAKVTGEGSRYAESLVRTAELCHIDRRGRFSPRAAALAALDRPSRLRQRVVRLLQGETGPRPSAAVWPIVLLASAAMIAVAAWRHHPAAAADSARSDDPRVAKAIDSLAAEQYLPFDPRDGWIASVRDLVNAGPEAVPALCRQLVASDNGFFQSTAAMALRVIGDRRAVPALIAALERAQGTGFSPSFPIADPELNPYYSSRLSESRESSYPGTVMMGQPVRELTAALERLTGHSEGDSHLRVYRDTTPSPGKFIKPSPEDYERERMLTRAVATRWRAWWGANRASLLSADELKWVDAFDRSIATPPGPTTSPMKGLQIRVTTESGQAAGGAAIEAWTNNNHLFSQADSDGRAALSLPQATSTSIVIRQAGCVPTRIWFGPDDQLPDHYDLKLGKGATVGGTLLGTKDTPAPGVRVRPVAAPKLGAHEWANLFDLVAISDADGHWVIDGVPAGFHGKFRVEGSAAPPDAPVAVDDETCGMQTSAEELAARKVIWKLKPLHPVKGQVVDAAGRPVAGAQVLVGGWLDPVRSDNDGRFSVTRVREGKQPLIAQAADFGSVQLEVVVKDDMADQTVTLPPPQPLLGHVVDQSGRAVVGAEVRNTFDGQWRLFDFDTFTGAAGEFVWTGVPKRDINLAVYKAGYNIGHAQIKAGQKEVNVPLEAVLRIGGAVVDARTHQPVRSFTVLQGLYWGSPEQMITDRGLDAHFTGGSYDLKFYRSEMERREDRRYLRVEADGYKPAFSRAVDPHESAVTIDFALEPGEPIAGKVILADGSPARGAEVILSTPTMNADIYRGKVRRNDASQRPNALFVETDAGGAFSLPPQAEPYEILVTHDSGWARSMREQFQEKRVLTLAPWGRIEGEVRHGGKPTEDAQITLTNSYYQDREAHPDRPHVQLFSTERTDADGRFVFPRIYPGHFRVSGQNRQQGTMNISGPGVPVDVVAGQVLQISFGTDGQHEVTGKIAIDVPPGSPQPDPATMQVDLIEAKPEDVGRAPDPTLPKVRVPIAADGSFRIDSVKAGLWRLTTQFDMPLGPHDADLRGKYVLLDFWATWCGPCIGETPNLKAVHDAFKDDPHFAMVSLSIDFDPGKLRAYVNDNHMTWTQALLEGNWDNRVVRTYGVSGIPAILLIGPDGKIIAPNLRGAAIETTVAEALGKQPAK